MVDAIRTLDDIRDEYGMTSPEYAARVYEDMLDSRYERRAALDDEIDKIGEHLEREKRDITTGRAGRRRMAAWLTHEIESDERVLAEIARDA